MYPCICLKHEVNKIFKRKLIINILVTNVSVILSQDNAKY